MLVLRIYTPNFSFEQKKIMAAELTDALIQTLALPDDDTSQITIQFIPYQLENMAVNGRLLSETEEPVYLLEFHSKKLSSHQTKTLQQHLLPLLLELLGLKASDAYRVTFLFHEHPVHRVYTREEVFIR